MSAFKQYRLVVLLPVLAAAITFFGYGGTAHAQDTPPTAEPTATWTAQDYFERGVAHYDQGDLEAAIADFDRAVALDPGYVNAYVNRGIAYTIQGDLEAAIADFDRAIGLDPDFAYAYGWRGVVHFVLGNDEQALADYRQYERLTGRLEPFMGRTHRRD